MGTIVVNRLARRSAPALPSGEVLIEPPPEIPQATAQRLTQVAMLVPMLAGTLATAMMFAGRQGGAYSYVVGGVFGLSSLGMLATSLFAGAGSPRRTEMMTKRRDYIRHLGALRKQVRATAVAQRAGMTYRHPAPNALWSTVASHRLWERRPLDADFSVVRVGTGPQSLATPLVPPQSRPPDELEPMTAAALRRFLDAYAVVPDLPVAVSLRSFSRVILAGAREATTGLARAMVAQLATFHAPEDLLIAAVVPDHRRTEWEWLKWLPHNGHPDRLDRLGPQRLIASTAADLVELLDDVVGKRSRFNAVSPQPATPHVAIVLAGAVLAGSPLDTEQGIDGVTVIDLPASPPRTVDRWSIQLAIDDDGRLSSRTIDDHAVVGVADQLSAPEALALARAVAPIRMVRPARGTEDTSAVVTDSHLADLLGVADAARIDVADLWAPRPVRDRLRVPFGVDPAGQLVELDFKESALGGMGPHGVLLGATGSGKSELMRTLLLTLAVTHSPIALNFVLMDFKGGAAFAPLARLPHTAAVVTNLADDAVMVERLRDALAGELERRQQVLHDAGKLDSMRDYEAMRLAGAPLAPMPTLLVVCDEFAQLMENHANFTQLFQQIGRVGRSLGVHLLLSSQKLSGAGTTAMIEHASYRLALRVDANESLALLGNRDAVSLPRPPGQGYLKVADEPPIRFKTAYVSGPYQPHTAGRPRGASLEPAGVIDFTSYPVPVPSYDAPPPALAAAAENTTELELVVAQLTEHGPPARQIWLPPLSDPATLDALLGSVDVDPQRGITATNPALQGARQVPLGEIDVPRRQSREVMWVSLDGATGNIAAVGRPQSGKSNLLRTLVVGLALTHTPVEVQVYCLDFGSGLAVLRDLPHVGAVAGRRDIDLVQRTVFELTRVLEERERVFAAAGLDSMAAYRAWRANGASDADPYGEVYLVIDGVTDLQTTSDRAYQGAVALATRGPAHGIHVAAAGTKWSDFRSNGLSSGLFGTRIQLAVDAAEAMVTSRKGAIAPIDQPGRAVLPSGLHMMTAVPALAAPELSPDQLIREIARSWPDRSAPAVQLLPTAVPFSSLPAAHGLNIPIGFGELDLQLIRLDFASEPHLLVFGDGRSGKTSFLRALATSIVAGNPDPATARLVLIDYRRTLVGAVESEHLMGHCSTPETTLQMAESIAEYMHRRRPPADVTVEQMRSRSWWSGPECFVLVDDSDMVASGLPNPLEPLLPYLPQAHDFGLHVVIARRSSGSARGGDVVLSRMRDNSTARIVLSTENADTSAADVRGIKNMEPGRGYLVTRQLQAPQLIQLAYLPPP